jgi:prepilin-type N-terminal cleavage/methylation domain-containing protein
MMRKGLTLIELIFSMLIIAVVFSVVPKIIFASNKSIELSVKEDALFNAYSMICSIVKLDWDENTLNEGKVLDTDSHDCSDYRVGGFKGSRNCLDTSDSASAIGREDSDYNDIDDYYDYNETVQVGGKNRYVLKVDINYVDANYSSTGSNTDELKEINVTVSTHSDNAKTQGFKSSFFFYSANLGHIQIKKEQWK